MGTSVAISADTRNGHEMLRLQLQPPRSLCASTDHYPHTPRSLCSPPLLQSRDPVTTSLGEHTACLRLLQRHAGLCHRRLAPAFCTPPSPQPEKARAPELATTSTPSYLSEEQTTSGDIHTQAGPNPKLKPRSCVNKEEKGKFLPAAPEAVN